MCEINENFKIEIQPTVQKDALGTTSSYIFKVVITCLIEQGIKYVVKKIIEKIDEFNKIKDEKMYPIILLRDDNNEKFNMNIFPYQYINDEKFILEKIIKDNIDNMSE